MTFKLTVITCTHNPKLEYLDKVLRSLMSQTLPLDQWEYLFIDNKSNQDLSSEVDLSWHPNARHVREEQLGLTPARLRGIYEAKADILVFVDDDNVLNCDYLKEALKISKEYTFIGAWGGQIKGEYEVEPPTWSTQYLSLLAIREVEFDMWSNSRIQNETTPCGAGICIRKNVAESYAERVKHDSKSLMLGRRGASLTSGEDTDMALTACDLGYGTGQFKELSLLHLISASRLTEEYFAKLVEGMTYSHTVLATIRGKCYQPDQRPAWLKNLSFYYCSLKPFLKIGKNSAIQEKLKLSEMKGYLKAIETLNGAELSSSQKL